MTALGQKRTAADENIQDVQAANQDWWPNHTMSYDWNESIETDKCSAKWFSGLSSFKD